MNNWDEYEQERERYYGEIRRKKASERCVCDVEYGMCPGRSTCPYSGDEQGEENE